MFSGVSRNVVKIRLIRLGSCRSTIELRPRTNKINHLEILTVNFVCHFFVKHRPRTALPSLSYTAQRPRSNRLDPTTQRRVVINRAYIPLREKALITEADRSRTVAPLISMHRRPTGGEA
jgi:hypothetical protein